MPTRQPNVSTIHFTRMTFVVMYDDIIYIKIVFQQNSIQKVEFPRLKQPSLQTQVWFHSSIYSLEGCNISGLRCHFCVGEDIGN